MVQVLLKVGADVEAKEMAGKTPLDLARNDEVKTALREHGAKHSLVYAAEEGMVELVADLINEGAEVNEKDHTCQNPSTVPRTTRSRQRCASTEPSIRSFMRLGRAWSTWWRT